MDAMHVAGNRRSEVVVAMANVVVVVAEAKCRVPDRSGPDARALRRIETRRGVPGWLEGGRPLTSPQAFFLSVCSVVMVVERGVLDTKYIYFYEGHKPEVHKTYPPH
jgi:hypothetical protein